MNSCSREHVRSIIEGQRVALVGGGPSAFLNEPGYIDSHHVVVRVNNYKLAQGSGQRTDIFYSYFGVNISKTSEQLQKDGVTLCMAKCPDDSIPVTDWHKRHGRMNGVHFQYIYIARRRWWFCPVYIPTREEFMKKFALLGNHIPTTGFAALLDILAFNPAAVYLTGFDFFESRIHNGDEKWVPTNQADPIRHEPNRERDWIIENKSKYPLIMDDTLLESLERGRK